MISRRKNTTDWEGKEQESFFTWLRLQYPEAYDHAFHPPNGGHRNKIVASKLKRQGAKPGVPDIFIDLPRGGYHGFRAEHKAAKPHTSAVSEKQKEWIERLSCAGYYAVVTVGLDQLMDEVKNYLSLGNY